jgi:hypothetical protein
VTTPVFAPGLANDITLTETLRLTVPLHIEELQRLHPGGVPLHKPKDDATAIGTYGDTIQFAGRAERSPAGRRATTKGFNGLARGLAAMALEPDGVTFAGLHWCVSPHVDCPTPPRPEPKPVTDEEIAYVVGLLDEYEALCKAAAMTDCNTQRSGTFDD